MKLLKMKCFQLRFCNRREVFHVCWWVCFVLQSGFLPILNGLQEYVYRSIWEMMHCKKKV